MRFFRHRPPRTFFTTTDPLEIVEYRRQLRRLKEQEWYEANQEPTYSVSASHIYGTKELKDEHGLFLDWYRSL